jgi:phage repressor protein C with HTH and peptisase S24 domain
MAGRRKDLSPYSGEKTIRGRIAKLLLETDTTLWQLSRKTKGLPITTLADLYNDSKKVNLSIEQLKKAAEFFKVSLEWLLTGDESRPEKSGDTGRKTKLVPLYGSAICGAPLHEWREHFIKNLEVDFLSGVDPQNTFAVEAVGLSMAQTIMPGWIVFGYRPPNLPQLAAGEKYTVKHLKAVFKEGSLVVVSFKTFPGANEGVIKRIGYLDDDQSILLVSDNARNFRPLLCRVKDIYEIFAVYSRFIGKFREPGKG